MNIEVLWGHIATFERVVVDSGFRRDLDDYISSLPASQGNIVALRELANKVLIGIEEIWQSEVPDSLSTLLPAENVQPFTETPHSDNLRMLIANTEMQQPEFFQQLNTFLAQLKAQLEQNEAELTRIKDFVTPYLSKEIDQVTKDDTATLSVVFRHRKTISSLAQFTKTLVAWNKILPQYHQLLKSASPEDVRIQEVQNGSIDLVINVDVNVAIDLVELFKVGLASYGAYLYYKRNVKRIIESYAGNQKLIESEDEREVELLNNIGTAIRVSALDQHAAAKASDKSIKPDNPAKIAEQVTGLITSHIVKGNEIRLLSLPETSEEESQRNETLRNDIRKCSIEVRNASRSITEADHQKLLDSYGEIKDDE
jgi:hypothetical protein